MKVCLSQQEMSCAVLSGFLVDTEESVDNADLLRDIDLPPSAVDEHNKEGCDEGFESESDEGAEVVESDTAADEMDVDEEPNQADCDEMDVDETREERPPSGEREMTVLFRAGCAWAEQDWSCAYDTVFMVFFGIYSQSSPGWRGDWQQQSPEWTTQLVDCFDTLLEAVDSQEYSQERLSKLFSSFRDRFRHQLATYDAQRFPCQGQVPASICAILELLFGSELGPGVEETVVCTRCRNTSHNSHHFPLLAMPFSPQNHRLKTDPRFIPSATLLARFVQSITVPPSSSLCFSCLHETLHTQRLEAVNSPWIWFEVDSRSTMSPSVTVPVELSGQRLEYDLSAIIYHGRNHFNARLRDMSGRWWNYDGMERLGAAQEDHIQIPTDLLQNGRLHAAFFIYHRSEC